jgi:two-component system NarL family sensor kinase
MGLVSSIGVPLAIMLAIIRHGLYRMSLEVDALVNRLVVYATLTGLALLVYWAVSSFLVGIIPGRPGFGPALVGIVAAVAVCGRLRRDLRRGVDRLLYRKRKYDHRVIAALGECFRTPLGPQAVLSAIVETIANGLKLPYVAMTAERQGQAAASATYGQPASEPVELPLLHQGETVGHLVVTARSPEEAFDDADRRLLDDLASQAGVIAYALCLNADLQRSRERLVTAQEEERRRLRRDLHDGLQPALAGISLGLEAVRNILGPDGAANELLARLKSELETAAADVRRLVYDLRPPALDELGLVGALRQHASRFRLPPSEIDVVIKGPEALDGLPAAVEVAAYRIGQEALENVRKHARATRCEVYLDMEDGQLSLEVRDDGGGLGPNPGLGVGLIAMQERAAEVGGNCSIESTPGWGTRVRARFPTRQ